MKKSVDLSMSIYDLCSTYPEIKEIMQHLGFTDITKPGMLNTAGRFMTIAKGASMKGISLEKIKAEFEKEGFQLEQ
jgi:formate-dependent phosphoribosylglycinamide formyltransferase (GAR transformylase)